jgi:hypothetical protein
MKSAPKNNQLRTITLPAFAVEALRRHKRERPKNYCGLASGNPATRWSADGSMARPSHRSP